MGDSGGDGWGVGGGGGGVEKMKLITCKLDQEESSYFVGGFFCSKYFFKHCVCINSRWPVEYFILKILYQL